MESQQFVEEEGRNFVSSSSDEALAGVVSEKIHLTNCNLDVSRRVKRRAILKDGYTNTFNSNVPLAGLTSITQDFFTFMMECRWRTLLLLFFTSFVISWLIFALLYWAVAFGHGDLRDYKELHDPTKEMCITAMDDFISCFLFSMETQYSSGYGTRSPTTECPEAVFLVGFQSIFGALLQLSMSGILFAKFARPKMRHQAIMFSHRAVISLRDRSLCLMFRVGDCRKSRLLGATLYARLLQHRVSAEGERLPHYQHALKLSVDSSGSNVFLLWPLTAVHRIDSSSPLYDISADDLSTATFELLVVLSGTVETMGQDTEARTSYTASEILWGHRLLPLVKTCGRGYILDYSRFHSTVPVDTPRCSAKQLHSWTHNYVLLNRDGGLLGNKDQFFDTKDHFLDKSRFLDNKGQFLDNRDQFKDKKEQYLDNNQLDNRHQSFDNNQLFDSKQILYNKNQFSESKEQLMGNREGLLDNKEQLSDKGEVLVNNDQLFFNNDNEFPFNNDSILEKNDVFLGNRDDFMDKDVSMNSKEGLLGREKGFIDNKHRFSEKEGLLYNREGLLDIKDKYLERKDGFFENKEELLGTNEEVLEKKDKVLGNKNQIREREDELLDNKEVLPGVREGFLGSRDERILGADYRERDDIAQNLSNLSGPVRKHSKILKEGPEKELHRSLMSLHEKKQRSGLSTLSEDDLR